MSELLTRTITGAVLVTVVISATVYSKETSIALWSLFAVLGIKELIANKMGGMLGALSISVTAGSLVMLGFFDFDGFDFTLTLNDYRGMNIVAFLCAIWANDSFAYLGGMALGRKFISRGLAPEISPKKSWEGALIGALAASVVGFLFLGTTGVFIAFGIGILATLSDLVESKAKRKAGIKDSGTLLPGHGGVLDRFDGLLLSAPITFALIYLMS